MTVALKLTVRDGLQRRLNAVARERGITPEAVAEFALAAFLEDADGPKLSEWQAALVEEGLSAARNGDFATNEEVEQVLGKYRA